MDTSTFYHHKISFQLNSTENLTKPINSNIVVFLCIYYIVIIVCSENFGAKVENDKIECLLVV